ncbi:FAD-binding oxidoreductase [soil metagenome]
MMAARTLTSWGRVVQSPHALLGLSKRNADLPELPAGAPNLLPYGNGRSYGDSCLNAGGALLKTRTLDRFISFDPESGVLVCESGVLFDEILKLVVSQGWFLPVTPGTRFVTVGGAIANDVHGKNHHRAGTFGCHVQGFELLRSDGQRLLCSRSVNPEYFAASIGGLGLTGLITWAEIQLRRIGNPWMDVETIRYRSLDEFFALSSSSDQDYEYTVAWIDCAARGRNFGRGLFMRANHAPAAAAPVPYQPRKMKLPVVPPISMINSWSLKAFNALYYHKQIPDRRRALQHYEPFFYPLDGILEWNRMYGPRGFYQYQCVIPLKQSRDATARLLFEIGQSGMGSFLAVLKICGSSQSPGMLSFPMSGVSLALDFPNSGKPLHQLFDRLDVVVHQAGGRIYPAKDGRMPRKMFQAGYPEWKAFTQFIDPQFSSSFWRRVTGPDANQ